MGFQPSTYAFDLTRTSPVNQIVETIREYGLCRVDAFLKDTRALEEEALQLSKKDAGNYAFGKTAMMRKKDARNYPALYELFHRNSFMEDCAKAYITHPHTVNEYIFVSHDFTTKNGRARNGYLHFDRTHTFKFYFYLKDVLTTDSGPFSCIPGTRALGKKMREMAWIENNSYANVRNRIFEQYNQESYKECDILPVFGRKGAMIIFDTDLFHLGGITNGGERLVIRGHTTIPC